MEVLYLFRFKALLLSKKEHTVLEISVCNRSLSKNVTGLKELWAALYAVVGYLIIMKIEI